MRCLTVRQPYADLIVAGVKDVENRSRPPTWWTLPEYRYCSTCGKRFWPGPDQPDSCDGTGGRRLDAGHAPTRLTPDGPYPFRLAIHAGRGWDHDAHNQASDAHRRLRHDSPRWGGKHRTSGLTVVGATAAILGTVEVTGSHHADDCWEDGHNSGEHNCGAPEHVPGHESWCGWEPFCSRWAEPDRHHWTLADPRPLDDPIPCRGQQGLWRLDDDVADGLRGVAA